MPTPLNNIDFLGRCYDIVNVDPLDLGGSSKNLAAIDLNAIGTATSADGRCTIPAVSQYASGSGQDYRDDTVLVCSSSDYRRALSGSVSARPPA